MGGIFWIQEKHLDTKEQQSHKRSDRVLSGQRGRALLLALLLLKYQLDERKVSAGILAVYILSGLSGGIYMGKQQKEKDICGE